MLFSIVSYDGTNLNDSNFAAYFAENSIYTTPQSSPVYIQRQGKAPVLTYKDQQPAEWAIRIKMLGTIHSQIQTLKALFDTRDQSLKTFLVKDTADSDKQYYVLASAVRYLEMNNAEFIVLLAVPDPIWKSNTLNTDTWNVTATAATNDVTVAGHVYTEPIITITPNNAKDATGRDIYKRAVFIYNTPQTSVRMPAFTNYPVDITDGGINTVTLIADNSNKVQINNGAGIDNVVTTIPYDTVTGTIPSNGMGYVDTEQIKWTGRTGTTSGNLTGVTRGIGGTTAASHLDNAEIKCSKVLANGNDLKIVVDGNTIDRWFGTGANAMNQTNTKIWCNLNMQGQTQSTYLVLATAIAGSGAISSITLSGAGANEIFGAGYYTKWPDKGRLLIGTEVFTYLALDPAARQLTGVTRAALGTSEGAHAVGDGVRLLDHEIWITYGNQDATAPTVDDTRKPMFALTSTNTSWVYADFNSGTAGRTGAWLQTSIVSLAPLANRKTNWYTTSQDVTTGADPYAVAGNSLAAWLQGTVWKAETGETNWSLYNPVGFTTITVTGFKYRIGSSWPTIAGMWKNGATTGAGLFAAVWTEATPASPSSWTALTAHSSVSLSGTYTTLTWRFGGSIAAVANGVANMEMTDCTLTLDSTRDLTITLGSEIGPAAGYFINSRITNTENGEWMEIEARIDLDQTLTIDCENKQVTYDFDDSLIPVTLRFSSMRDYWLKLLPAQVNTLQYDETGVTDEDIVIKWRDREP